MDFYSNQPAEGMNSDSFCELLLDHGIRPTANRILVVKTLERAGRPLSMSEIEEQLVTIDKSIVSRTLALLREHHAVHVIEGAHEGVRYELCHSHDHAVDNDMHVHFHCERCGETICLEELAIPEVQLPEGYLMQSANFVLKGICPKCQKYPS